MPEGSSAVLENPIKAVPSIQIDRDGQLSSIETKQGIPKPVLPEVYHSLSANPGMEHIAAQYGEVISQSDAVIEKTRDALSQLSGAALIPEVAHANISRQANQLIEAAHTLLEKDEVTISLFGERKTLKTQEEVEGHLAKTTQDFEHIIQQGDSFAEFNTSILPTLDKYLFAGIEVEAGDDFNILFIEGEDKILQKELSEKGIVKSDNDPASYTEDEESFQSAKILTLALPRSLAGDHYEHLSPNEFAQAVLKYEYPVNKPFYNHKHPPDIVIIDQRNCSYPQELFIHYDPAKHEEVVSDKPVQVILADKGSVERDSYLGTYLICYDIDQLSDVLGIAKSLVNISKNNPVDVETLVSLQLEQYEASDDLPEWSEKTAKLDKELEDIFKIFQSREDDPNYPSKITPELSPDQRWYFERVEQEERDVVTVLDVGGGYGRIGTALARAGKHVVNVDPSTKLQDQAKHRLKELGAALRGEKKFSDRTAEVLEDLHTRGLIPGKLVLDDAEAEKNYVTRQGSFQGLYENLYNLMKTEWKQHSPNQDMWDFFVPPGRLHDKYTYTGEDFLWSVVGFDAAIETWHTACEKPTLELQRSGAQQVFEALEHGGVYIIEIPDRIVDPYASEINDYHKKHPSERLGTLRETFEGQEFTPRYFPDRNEIVLLLRSVGFDVDPEKDISTYFITEKDQNTGEEKLLVKELVITAHKPWDNFNAWVV